MNSWNDGTMVYTIKNKKKKKEVEIHSAKNNKSDKYSEKFKFEPENFTYSVAEHEQGLMLTLKAKKGAKGIKEIHALVERKTYHPISLRIKVSIIWTTIKISNFQSGGITDEMLRFPREKFKDYEFVDKRDK
jgi:hypothetical protein